MITTTEVTRYVKRVYARTPPETLKKASDECDTYTFQKAGANHYACVHGDNAYVIIERGDEVGCSCGDMTYHCQGNEICKHLTTFLRRSRVPTAKLGKEIVRDLITAGWVGANGELHPPETTSDADHAVEPMPEPPSEDYSNCRNVTSDPDGEDNGGNDPVPDRAPKPTPAPRSEPDVSKLDTTETHHEEEPKMAEKETKIYTHPDGTEFESAEALLDYVEAVKEGNVIKETKALVASPDSPTTSAIEQAWSDEQLEVMRKTVAEKASPAEFAHFLNVAKYSGLNPFLKEIYFMKTDKGQTASITSRDGYLTIAKRDSRFMGIQSMEVCETDVFKMSVTASKDRTIQQEMTHQIANFNDRGEIVGAWARGQMRGQEPVIIYASMAEYDKKSQQMGGKIWKQYPSSMIRKVAESMVLKRIAGISGLVTEAEIAESKDMMLDAEVV